MTVPSDTDHRCLNLLMGEAFYSAGGAVSVSLVNELPEISGLEAHAEG